MNKICLELTTFEEFATAVLQTIAKKCLSVCDHFFQSVAKTSSASSSPKKKLPFENKSWINSMRTGQNIRN